MASFSFGSFGDIITICQLVKAAVDALDESRGSAADYQALKTLLLNLAYVLFKIQALVETKKISDPDMLTRTLEDCFATLKSFMDKIKKYDGNLGSDGSGNWFKDSYRKIRWPSMKEDVTAFRDTLAVYLDMLQLLLQGAGIDARHVDKGELYKRLDKDQAKQTLRFKHTEEEIAAGFSSQRIMLDRIFDAVQSASSRGVSNADTREATNVRVLQRQTTALSALTSSSSSVSTEASFESAALRCRQNIQESIQSHRRLNIRYVDQNFDIARDIRLGSRDCLETLVGGGKDFQPGSSQFLDEVFKNPALTVDGYSTTETVSQIPQLLWISTALMAISTRRDLVERVFIVRDEALGIYGFMFFRDGNWFSEVIDCQLYLDRPSWNPSLANDPFVRKMTRNGRNRDPESFYKETFLTDSQSLYFTASLEPSETWPSLFEKAYAKAHGDYGSIADMFVGDVLEDLTGGVTFEHSMQEILSHDRFWGILQLVGTSAIFIAQAARDALYSHDSSPGGRAWNEAIVIRVIELNGERLVCLRSSTFHWNGPWSDGSKEWTPEWLRILDYKFGTDDIFWMSYRDFRQRFQVLLEHMILSEDWNVAQQWIAVEVPWANEYLKSRFDVTVGPGSKEDDESVEVVIVLSQLDDTYFRGLEGSYRFELQFNLEIGGETPLKSPRRVLGRRSVGMKYIVAAGSSFSILPYVIATKLSDVDSISTVVARNAVSRRDKLLRTALSYDLAHAQIPRWREESERIQRRQERRGQRMAKDNKDKTSGQGLKSELDAPFLSRQDVLGQVSWDALCALGVRVYAKGAAVTITWQDDRDSEEGDETAEEEGELDLADDKAEAEEQTAGKGSDDEKTGEAL